MNLKEQMLFNIHGNVNKILTEEEKIKNFSDELSSDIKDFGIKETIQLYNVFYGIELNESMGGDAAATAIGKSFGGVNDVGAGQLGNAAMRAAGPSFNPAAIAKAPGFFARLMAAITSGNFSGILGTLGKIGLGGGIGGIAFMLARRFLFKKIASAISGRKDLTPEQKTQMQKDSQAKLSAQINARKAQQQAKQSATQIATPTQGVVK